MARILDIAKWSISLGHGPQNFLGARWVPAFLRRVPASRRRIWALRMLSLSPHYFFDGDNPAYRGMRGREYLETVFRINAESRVEIYEKLLMPELTAESVVLDYGCGPGFLAKAVAPHVKKLYAIDISVGALECARILNPAENIEYLSADDRGLETIPEGSIDVAYSFAVFQHLTDDVLANVLANTYEKLRTGGKLIVHVQLADDMWRTEIDWRRDASLRGRVKFRYGLHCFGRTENEYQRILDRQGFEVLAIRQMEDVFGPARNTDSQRMIYAQRPM
jgi:SAM-dependent methyltransferase